MDLMNLEPLRALQSIDSAIQSLEKELDAFPKALEAARLDEAAVEAKHAVAKEALDAVQKRRRSLEREIEAVAENVRKYETEKTRVKTNEEFRALNNQIAHEKSRQSEIEDQVLFSFDEEATCAEREKTLQVELEAVKKATAAREVEIRRRTEEDRRRLDELRSRRGGAAAAVEPRILSRYENTRTRKGGLAVVPVVRGSCGGCYTQQPLQVVNEVRRQDALIVCEFCGRFLVWEDSAI
jgi:predicted  nucleic acid-binding Zn-ribbon protein